MSVILTGVTATKEIIRQFPEAHICMVTSYDDSELRTAANAVASDFVVKDDLSKLCGILSV